MGGSDGRFSSLRRISSASRARGRFLVIYFCLHCLRKMPQFAEFQSVLGEGKWRQTETLFFQSSEYQSFVSFFLPSQPRFFPELRTFERKQVKAKGNFAFTVVAVKIRCLWNRRKPLLSLAFTEKDWQSGAFLILWRQNGKNMKYRVKKGFLSREHAVFCAGGRKQNFFSRRREKRKTNEDCFLFSSSL